MKKVIVLGASRYYSKSIESAKKAGYYIIALDKNPDSAGFLVANEGIACDIADKEGVLKITYQKEESDNTHHFIGSFVKSYNIPEDVKEKDIEGKVENGVLTLSLPIDKKKSLERLISLN